jgi:hypothetical protein
MQKRATKKAAAEVRKRLVRAIGRIERDKLVAVDRRSGAYVVADDLDDLLGVIGETRSRRQGDFLIFRLGSRAAIEFRLRWPHHTGPTRTPPMTQRDSPHMAAPAPRKHSTPQHSPPQQVPRQQSESSMHAEPWARH